MPDKTKLSPPWEIFNNKLCALFAGDPEIEILTDFTEEYHHIKILVENPIKADAIGKLLPDRVNFGGVEVEITIIPANENTNKAILEAAFRGNSAFANVVEAAPFPGLPECVFGMFKPKVAQFYGDNTADPNGLISMLFENVARDVFTGVVGEQIRFSTAPICE